MNLDNIGISLGWKCEAAQYAVDNGFRKLKRDGYKTCPFDLAATNYIGICKCIEDDFKYFCDPKYLELRLEPKLKKIMGDYQTEDQYWIYNTYYNFAFNHESPGHGELYKSENWENGINHFVNNNFEKFIERYNNRIENFRYYLKNYNHINFVMYHYNSIPYELENIIATKYPTLKFNIYCRVNFSQQTLGVPINKTQKGAIEFELAYFDYLNIDKNLYPEQYNRYIRNFDINNFQNINSSRIKIIT
jgi:hypothetical protein